VNCVCLLVLGGGTLNWIGVSPIFARPKKVQLSVGYTFKIKLNEDGSLDSHRIEQLVNYMSSFLLLFIIS
jgi:hypothetical protein